MLISSEMFLAVDLAADDIDASAMGEDPRRRVPPPPQRADGRAWGPVPKIDVASVQRFLDLQLAGGAYPNTVRKYVGMLRAHYLREYERGRFSAQTLLAVVSVRPPCEATRRAQPQLYRRIEIRELWTTFDERWPKLPRDEALHWGQPLA